ncbi:hypothetical protein AAEX63_08235 [Luteococcus sp. H138]|uniref:hypothetical protein n=1 Tax=unclassified Luteococcus TaxID=2639923 RepID=UPI00313C5C04
MNQNNGSRNLLLGLLLVVMAAGAVMVAFPTQIRELFGKADDPVAASPATTVGTTAPTGNQPTQAAAPATVVTTVSAAAPAPSVVTVTAQAPQTTQIPNHVGRAGVRGTCGANGKGDCYISLRAQPSSTSAELGRVPEGGHVSIVCQVYGSTVKSSVYGSSNVWTRTLEGAYVANIFLEADGLSQTEVTHAC